MIFTTHRKPEPRVEEVTEPLSPNLETSPKVADGKRRTLLQRLGWQSITILVLTTLASLAVIGFLGFIWFAHLEDGVWHRIMVNGWATRAVSIATLVLRSAIDLQAGVAAAMLAALVLESSTVRLRDAARLSTMRAGSPQPRALLDIIPAMSSFECQFFRLGFIGYGGAVILLFATTTLLQFSSTILLSDLGLGQLPSLTTNRSASYDFVYTGSGQPFSNNLSASHGYYGYTGRVTYPIQLRGPTWSRNPPAFPAFAEYSKPISSPEGVDDTGVLLRAFLPFADAQSRESIRNYSGIALVLDSRVSCQAPKLNDASVTIANWWYQGVTDPTGGTLRGTLEPSVTDVDKLWTPGPIPFNCGTFMNVESMSICQVGFDGSSRFYQDSGSLLSEFWNISQVDTRSAILQGGLIIYSLPMLVVQSHASTSPDLGEKVTGTDIQGTKTVISTNSSSWTISLCYSAWATADLDVEMFSSTNRSEPIAQWDQNNGYYTVPDIHDQLGDAPATDASLKSRGILQLAEKASWIPNVDDSVPNAIQPFVQSFADLSDEGNLMQMRPYQCSHCSALLAPYNSEPLQSFDKNKMFPVDFTLTDLFHQAMEKGSMARAVSSLITTLSSMAYYDQMPQFQRTSETSQVFFTTVLFPQAHQGFWLVAIVLAAHIGLVALIAVGFAIYSHNTLLGNHWQSIAQLQGPETNNLLARTRMATDGEVKRALKVAGYEDVRVGVRSLTDERGVGLSALRQRNGPGDVT